MISVDGLKKIRNMTKAIRDFMAVVTLPDGLDAETDSNKASWPDSISMIKDGVRVIVPISYDETANTISLA